MAAFKYAFVFGVLFACLHCKTTGQTSGSNTEAIPELKSKENQALVMQTMTAIIDEALKAELDATVYESFTPLKTPATHKIWERGGDTAWMNQILMDTSKDRYDWWYFGWTDSNKRAHLASFEVVKTPENAKSFDVKLMKFHQTKLGAATDELIRVRLSRVYARNTVSGKK